MHNLLENSDFSVSVSEFPFPVERALKFNENENLIEIFSISSSVNISDKTCEGSEEPDWHALPDEHAIPASSRQRIACEGPVGQTSAGRVRTRQMTRQIARLHRHLHFPLRAFSIWALRRPQLPNVLAHCGVHHSRACAPSLIAARWKA